jgi:hypothetical protein
MRTSVARGLEHETTSAGLDKQQLSPHRRLDDARRDARFAAGQITAPD